MTRFPNPVSQVATQQSHQGHRFEGSSPSSAFDPQPAVAASRNQNSGQSGNQAKHDEALRQNALHRQMLAEVEEKHRAAAQVKPNSSLSGELRFHSKVKLSNWKGSGIKESSWGSTRGQQGSRVLCWSNQNCRHIDCPRNHSSPKPPRLCFDLSKPPLSPPPSPYTISYAC